jgi:hypothetical protein
MKVSGNFSKNKKSRRLQCFYSIKYKIIADLLQSYCLNIILNRYICNERDGASWIQGFFA